VRAALGCWTPRRGDNLSQLVDWALTLKEFDNAPSTSYPQARSPRLFQSSWIEGSSSLASFQAIDEHVHVAS
jgi:hypothetical protein